jgi:neutral ceramidase
MLEIGIGREIITPARGIPLCGYLNPRPNTGIFDDLFVRTVIFKKDGVISGLIIFDLCFLSPDIVERIKSGIKTAGMKFAGNLIFSATHTHTGPYADDFIGVKADTMYLESLKDKAVLSVKQAYANLSQAELMIGSLKNNPLAFNRRYWMKNGQVMTNPGKLNPDIVKPEGPVDTEIGVIAVRQDGRISTIIANIVNHTDTVGGNFVSADWPGRMEKAIQDSIGYDVPVLTLLGCSGNINHLDVSNDDEYYGYAEACRIGKAYAGIIGGMLKKLKKLPVEGISVSSTIIDIPFRTISDAESKNAKAIITRIGNVNSNEDLTSEGLATGDGLVAKFFAEQLIDYKKVCSGKSRKFNIVSIKFDDKLAFISLPGEPFTEIGLEIKKRSPFKKTWPVTLAMGECGYIPMPECFKHGGYEILPVVGCAPREDTAERIISVGIGILKSAQT